MGQSAPRLACSPAAAARPQVDFRIVTERVVMRSQAGGYGVPFDFVHEDANAAVEGFAAAHQGSQH